MNDEFLFEFSIEGFIMNLLINSWKKSVSMIVFHRKN